MKKSLSIVAVLMVALFSAMFLTACGNSVKYFLPNITTDIEGFKIEHVINRNGDISLPVDGESLLKADYDNYGSISWAWIIKKDDSLIGWITTDGGYNSNKRNEEYGFVADKNGGKKIKFITQYVSVTFINKDVSVFDNVDILTNCGYFSKGETTDYIPGGTNVVRCIYALHLEDENPSEVDNINITIRINQF